MLARPNSHGCVTCGQGLRKIPPVDGSRTNAPGGTPRTSMMLCSPYGTVNVARRSGALRKRIAPRRRMIITRLILCDRRPNQCSGQGSRSRPNRRAMSSRSAPPINAPAAAPVTAPKPAPWPAGVSHELKRSGKRTAAAATGIKVFFHSCMVRTEWLRRMLLAYSTKLQQMPGRRARTLPTCSVRTGARKRESDRAPSAAAGHDKSRP